MERDGITSATGDYTASAVIDERGLVAGWSEGARRLLGYAPAEVLGQAARTLLAEDRLPRCCRPRPGRGGGAAGCGCAAGTGTAWRRGCWRITGRRTARGG